MKRHRRSLWTAPKTSIARTMCSEKKSRVISTWKKWCVGTTYFPASFILWMKQGFRQFKTNCRNMLVLGERVMSLKLILLNEENQSQLRVQTGQGTFSKSFFDICQRRNELLIKDAPDWVWRSIINWIHEVQNIPFVFRPSSWTHKTNLWKKQISFFWINIFHFRSEVKINNVILEHPTLST